MNKKTAKARLLFVAEWWSPRVLKLDDPVCIWECAADGRYDPFTLSELRPLWDAWDRCDRRAAILAIERL